MSETIFPEMCTLIQQVSSNLEDFFCLFVYFHQMYIYFFKQVMPNSEADRLGLKEGHQVSFSHLNKLFFFIVQIYIHS